MSTDFASIKKLVEVEENVPIAPFVVSQMGGFADQMIKINSMAVLLKVLHILYSKKIPYRLIGQGSRSIFSHEGLPKLLIINSTSQLIVIQQHSQVVVESGIKISSLVNRLAEQELSGLEVFAQKNGSLGGWLTEINTLNQLDLCDFVKSISVYLPTKGIVTQFSGKWLSQNKKLFINGQQSNPVILNARLQLISVKKDSILLKIKNFSAKNQINSQYKGLLENIFIEDLDQQAINKLKLNWDNLQSDNPIDYIEKILTDSDIKKKLIPEVALIFKPNNMLLIKKNIDPVKIKNCLDAIISAVYDKFNVTLKYSISFADLVINHNEKN